jgi:hypothetical protein
VYQSTRPTSHFSRSSSLWAYLAHISKGRSRGSECLGSVAAGRQWWQHVNTSNAGSIRPKPGTPRLLSGPNPWHVLLLHTTLLSEHCSAESVLSHHVWPRDMLV